MGKFRSKLKRHTKGKSWGHGLSATSNPENKKHRNKARSRFFQPNLSLVPPTAVKESPLTLEAIIKHDASHRYATNKNEPTINDIASSLKSFNFNEDFGASEQGTFKSYKTFASTYSSCTNASFNKLLSGFRPDSDSHKEMLAILTAITEVITERGGNQSSTEYFLALMETIDAAKENKDIVAAISLLNMGIKTVPEAVLRKMFSETAETLLDIMRRFLDDADNQNVLRSILSCMASLLRAQEFALWQLSSTHEYFDALLPFSIHSKPKIRKSAQQAITSVIHGSYFMLPACSLPDPNTGITSSSSSALFHPAGTRVAKFSIQQFQPDNIANSQTVVLHTLGLLRDTLNGFRSEDIKIICEHLLSIMTAANVLIRTSCFHVLHSLFSSKTRNLSPILTGRLISAIYEYRPDRSDSRQTLAWLTVLKQAHIFLAAFDLTLCINSVPKLLDICASDLWVVDRNEIINGASHTIRELFNECIRPGCETKTTADIHRVAISKCIELVAKGLDAPFGYVATQVVLTFATVFEVTGTHFADVLVDPLRAIGNRYDPDSSFRLQIEHSILAAIPTMGPEYVLKAIPLGTSGNKLEVELNRSWILPLLREAISNATIEFFVNYILELANNCNMKWKKNKAENNVALAHTYELLCNQLWGLFPGFCRKPRDIHNFRYVAKILGTILNDYPELRAPVLDGLTELMTNAEDDGKNELSKYAKNFLPRLFNIYTTKPNGSYESDIRQITLRVIKQYLTITPKENLNEMFESAKAQQKSNDPGSFMSEAIFDIIEHLVLYQSADQLKTLFDEFVVPVLKKVKKTGVAKNVEKLKRQQRKAYELLHNILISENEECLDFINENLHQIQDLVLSALKTTCNTTQAARLKCITILLEKQDDDLSVCSNLIIRTIPEVIIAFNHGSNKRENVALNLVIKIGQIYQKQDQLNEFIDIVITGFGGDTVMITNTILILKSIVTHFTGDLTVNTLQFILEQVLVFLIGNKRNEAEASVAFLIFFIKALPLPLVANHLPTIVRSLSAMNQDTKRYCRIHIGFILKKMCKRFTAEEIIKLVPGNDEITHKKLKNIRKEQNRIKRQKISKLNANDSASDEENILEKKSYTIDDILADSDSDFDDPEDKKSTKTLNKHKKQELYIQEDPEAILDLADYNAISKITSNKFAYAGTNPSIAKERKAKDPSRGFKTAADGRLIIAEPKRGAGSSDSDDDNDEIGHHLLALSGSKKRPLNDDSDSDSDENKQSYPESKRKAIDSHSMASGRSSGNVSNKYVTGGRGIHRADAGRSTAGTSVKSGVSRMSMATTKTASTAYGSSYKSKKAKGDLKQKNKLDPYAYIPLNRSSLNKRKRAKNATHFKGIVSSAKKGAAAGAKSRIHKSYKKQK